MSKEFEQKFNESKNETWGCASINPHFCRSCLFAHGEPPFEDSPEKAYCMIYQRGESPGKPKAVYYEGRECDFYEKE